MMFRIQPISLLIVAALFTGSVAANEERASLEALRQTTSGLIDALVESGMLTREKADALIRKAEQDAAKKSVMKKPDTEVRVPYVPETVKSEIREQIKQEVLAQARIERWAEPNAVPGWLDSIQWEGDMRLRYQLDRFGEDNATPFEYATAAGTNAPPPVATDQTRAVGFTSVNSLGTPTANTTENRERFRVRARLGMLAKISASWSSGIRLTTGSTTDRVSTNQTLGQDFNKYSLVVDRAYIRFDNQDWLTVIGGRIPNPWFSSDLVWDEDLNFEGLAATFKQSYANDTIKPFLTIGAFPIKEENPPASSGRWMQGVQVGSQWDLSSSTRFKAGLAAYWFSGFEGQVERPESLDVAGGTFRPLAANYGQYEYGANLRQKGNSLFITNALGDTGTTAYWGLASKFRPINLTVSADLAYFDPAHVVLTADWVRNTAFDRAEINSRTEGRVNLTDGKNYGYHYKVTVGMPKVERARDWQFSLGYRYLGSDAVVDGFADSDFGGGGTNLKGYTLAMQYGVDRNAALGLRWMSADSIDSFSLDPAHQFSLDVLQADLNVRF